MESLSVGRANDARIARLLSGVCDLITRVAKLFLGVLVGAIVAITLAAVWWRYVLNAPLAWPEQISRIMFVWITFVGAAVLYRERLHVAIDMFMAPLPRVGRRAVGWAIELLILAFNIVLLVYGLKLSIDTLDQTFGALDITPASFYFAAPVAAGMMILYLLERTATPRGRASIEVRAGAGSSV
jgi:TRAP-type C4-dicarboxylate transport system permease small subunit